MSDAWPFGDLKPLTYRTIMADPPWTFTNRSPRGMVKNAAQHYPCMDTGAIAALPVGHLAAPDSLLFLWATAPTLPDALRVMAAWGFTFKTAGAWAKRTSTDKHWQFGTGYVLRSAAEFFLVGAIGAPRINSLSERNLIVAPVREHSRKPDAARAMVERLTDGPRAELFARSPAAGWDRWGNEVGKFADVATGAEEYTEACRQMRARHAAATCDRSPKGGDAQRLHAKHESAVPEGQSPTTLSNNLGPNSPPEAHDGQPTITPTDASSSVQGAAGVLSGGGSLALASADGLVRQSGDVSWHQRGTR